MEQNATVIFASDFILDDRLDQIAAALRERGYRVLRGREQKPPAIAAFDPVDCPRFFGQTDVILMTTRSRVTREILEASSKLRGVVFPTIGTESLDLNAAGELGIVVANGPTPENFLSMDESTAMLMTALLYGLHQTERLAGWQVRIVVFDPFLPANQAPPGGGDSRSSIPVASERYRQPAHAPERADPSPHRRCAAGGDEGFGVPHQYGAWWRGRRGGALGGAGSQAHRRRGSRRLPAGAAAGGSPLPRSRQRHSDAPHGGTHPGNLRRDSASGGREHCPHSAR